MKKIINYLILLFFLYITLQVLINSNEVILNVKYSMNIWKNKIFPSLFPFFILGEILLNYNLIYYLNKFLNKPMKLIFKVSGNASFIFFLSMLSGFPSSAKYTKDLISKNIITESEANKILMFTHFSNPLFIIGIIGNLIGFKNSILILIIHYTTNIIIGLLFRNLKYEKSNYIFKINENKFGIVITNAIRKSIDTLLIILGTMVFFIIITTIINKINMNNHIKFILNSFLEMTNGINYVSTSSISLKIKTIITTMILSFGGLSVHFQVISLISDTKIKYQQYLIARLLHTAISGILVFILYDWFF